MASALPIADKNSTFTDSRDKDKSKSNHESISVDVDTTMRDLLAREDTDGDCLITIDDRGPKNFPLGRYGTPEKSKFDVQGVYQLSNLLQELFLAQQQGRATATVKRAQLEEDPVHRLSRLITTTWWDNLTRRLDADGIDRAAPDNLTQRRDADGIKPTVSTPKSKSSLRIYVPPGAPEQFAYYSTVAKDRPAMDLDVQWLPDGEITADFIKSINDKPGILALDMEAVQPQGQSVTKQMKGVPFIVPGDQFNELYNWDACFCALGMLDNHLAVVKGIVKNFIFEIKHYAAILAARKEYHSWWTSTPRLDAESGLSRYRPIGKGSPPECRPVVFAHVFMPYGKKYDMTLQEVSDVYNKGSISEPDLDIFFDHDRAVRESGHDTSNRVEGVCADLATVDLNCLLFQIENDIASTIHTHFNDGLAIPENYVIPGEKVDTVETSRLWRERAEKRKASIDKYLWNEQKGIYLDYNTVTRQQSTAESVTCLWSLWCGAANKSQAERLVEHALPKFECIGGLSSTSESTRGTVTEENPQKQWDYPYGWAPHQVLAWDGLRSYGFHNEADRLAYRWLHMMTETFRNWNGTVVEKYDVTQLERSHSVDAEYGNQGRNFKYAPQEGCVIARMNKISKKGRLTENAVSVGRTLGLSKCSKGTVLVQSKANTLQNGSYIYGISSMGEEAKKALADGVSWEDFSKRGGTVPA
ncbi:MAG: hypothetical protein L6R42_004367 [Xanthoria sp. 1 TBL-2021]|nr:MAG: hypothetical protein L6R42_004367 [Xanthoria sp. 1 TBL-2021]